MTLDGEYLDAAIEFDGDFLIRSGKTSFTLETEDYPWIFSILSNNNLIAKKLNTQGTETILATDVIQVSAVRGFRSDAEKADQGMVAAYLKSNGTVWYVTRTKNQTTGTFAWSLGEQITVAGSGNTSVQVTRLNDFRIGVYVNEINKFVISEQTYIGDTFNTSSRAEHP